MSTDRLAAEILGLLAVVLLLLAPLGAPRRRRP